MGSTTVDPSMKRQLRSFPRLRKATPMMLPSMMPNADTWIRAKILLYDLDGKLTGPHLPHHHEGTSDGSWGAFGGIDRDSGRL